MIDALNKIGKHTQRTGPNDLGCPMCEPSENEKDNFNEGVEYEY